MSRGRLPWESRPTPGRRGVPAGSPTRRRAGASECHRWKRSRIDRPHGHHHGIGESSGNIEAMATYTIRKIGDPVLNRRTEEITDIDGHIAKLAEDMLETMYDEPGVGLAANQVGISKRLFVYDVGYGPITVVNPKIIETDGEWEYEEGCLSIPGLSFELVRPNAVHLIGYDLEGKEISIEADELEGRALQHEMDHLEGMLFIERLDDDQRKAAKKALREMNLAAAAEEDPHRTTASSGGLRLP
jgi:peptide deformylase